MVCDTVDAHIAARALCPALPHMSLQASCKNNRLLTNRVCTASPSEMQNRCQSMTMQSTGVERSPLSNTPSMSRTPSPAFSTVPFKLAARGPIQSSIVRAAVGNTGAPCVRRQASRPRAVWSRKMRTAHSFSAGAKVSVGEESVRAWRCTVLAHC